MPLKWSPQSCCTAASKFDGYRKIKIVIESFFPSIFSLKPCTNSPLTWLNSSKRPEGRIHTSEIPKLDFIVVTSGNDTSSRRVQAKRRYRLHTMLETNLVRYGKLFIKFLQRTCHMMCHTCTIQSHVNEINFNFNDYNSCNYFNLHNRTSLIRAEWDRRMAVTRIYPQLKSVAIQHK